MSLENEDTCKAKSTHSVKALGMAYFIGAIGTRDNFQEFKFCG